MKSTFVVVLEGLTYPDSWDPPDPYDPYRRNKLSPDSSEYKQVLTNVKKTSGLNEKHIIKVCVEQLM